jgi:hypothetical protein
MTGKAVVMPEGAESDWGGRGRQPGTRSSRGASGTRCASLRRGAARDVCAPRRVPNRTNEREERNALSRAVVCSLASPYGGGHLRSDGRRRSFLGSDMQHMLSKLVERFGQSARDSPFAPVKKNRSSDRALKKLELERKKNLPEVCTCRTSAGSKNSRERRAVLPAKNCAERFEKASPTHSRTRRRSPSSTRATLPSRLLPTARYPPQLPARSPASPRPARNAPRLAAHEHANRRDVRRARCRLVVGDHLGRTSRGRAAARGGAMRPRVERALERRRESGGLDPNRHAPRGRRGYVSFPTDAAASSNIFSHASESDWTGPVRVPARARPATAPGDETRDARATAWSTRSIPERARADRPPVPSRPLLSHPLVIPSRAVARERRQCDIFSAARARVAAGACADADSPCVPEDAASAEYEDDLDAMITVRRRARPPRDRGDAPPHAPLVETKRRPVSRACQIGFRVK